MAAILVDGAIFSDDELVHFGLHIVHAAIGATSHSFNFDLDFFIGDVCILSGVHLVVLARVCLVILPRRILVVLPWSVLVILSWIHLIILPWIQLVILPRLDFMILS